MDILAGNNELNVVMTLITGDLEGVVTDQAGPLAGVTVSTAGLSVMTDAGGYFAILGLVPGQYVVTLVKAGYHTETR